jgi:hypothetical protein
MMAGVSLGFDDKEFLINEDSLLNSNGLTLRRTTVLGEIACASHS